MCAKRAFGLREILEVEKLKLAPHVGPSTNHTFFFFHYHGYHTWLCVTTGTLETIFNFILNITSRLTSCDLSRGNKENILFSFWNSQYQTLISRRFTSKHFSTGHTWGLREARSFRWTDMVESFSTTPYPHSLELLPRGTRYLVPVDWKSNQQSHSSVARPYYLYSTRTW
jgi:hypothetical protein